MTSGAGDSSFPLGLGGKVAVLGATPSTMPSPRVPMLGFDSVVPLIGLSLAPPRNPS